MIVSGEYIMEFTGLSCDHKLHNHSQVYHKHPVLFQSIDYFIDYFCESFRHPCPISSIIVAGGERGGGLL